MDNEWIQIILVDKIKKEGNCRFLSVREETLKRLTHVRGNVYQDDQRLRVAKDFPMPEKPKEPEITPAMAARAEASWQLHLVGTRQAEPVQTVKAEPVLTFEEKVKEDWRTRPNIRAEFVSLASYEAYCRAVRDGRTKVCGRG